MSNYRFISATDNNPTYVGFIPSWIEHHKKLYEYSEIIVVLVSDFLPSNLEKYKNHIKLWKPIEHLPTAYQAQMIRMLYPILLDDKQNILCDMDLFLMTKDILIFFNRISNLDKRFINFGCLTFKDCKREKQLPFAFSVYGKQTAIDVFEVETVEDIKKLLDKEFIKDNSPRGYNWFTDQLYLYKKFIDYPYLTKIDRKGGDRVDRDWFNPHCLSIKNAIKSGKIVDFHAPRPYDKYKSFIHATLDSCYLPQ